MAVLQGTKALEAWCQIVTKDYPNVSISNMTSSWRSGLGFCALIHHFRPELLDYDSLSPDNAFENNSLAFSIAEQHLGINALLDPCDMVQSSSLDRLSILTYLSQFYQAFGGATTRSVSSNHVKSPFISKPVPRRDSSSLGGGGGPCQFCQKPVLFLLERYNINGLMAHRTCFKCARCASQLSLANYYETEKGDFCCEICPDEEVSQVQQALTNKLKRESQEREEEEEEEEEAALNSAHEEEEVVQAEEGSSTTPSVLQEEKAELDTVLTNRIQEEEKEENEIESLTNNHEEAPAASITVEKSQSSEDDLKVSEEEKDREEEVIKDETNSNIPLKEDNSDSEVAPEEDKKEEENPIEGVVEEININEEENKAPKDDEKKLPHCHDNLQELARDEEETAEDQTAVVPCESEDSTQERGVTLIGSQEQITSSEVPSEDYPEDLNPFDIDDAEEGLESTKALKEIENQSKSASLNPFGSDFEDEEEDEVRELTPRIPPPKPPRASQIIHSPCLNPFGSGFEESDGEGSRSTKSGFRSVSPSPSCSSSMTIRSRKKRRAPLPPGAASNHNSPAALVNSEYPKSLKERDNINRRSQISNLSFTENRVENSNNKPTPLTPLSPDKSDGGIWKKKKGPAPPRPIPPKRQVKKIPRKAVNTELIDIEVKQLEFERQGVQLEKTIRELCERDDSENSKENGSVHHEGEDSLGPEAEDLIIQLFELVNEKNELFRRQTELMYMKREHRLEEEHADLEYQIRVLMNKDTLNEDQKKEEEALISRLMTVVSQRNEIVDCLEMDRLRELEEDESIEIHMGEFAAVKPPPESSSDKKKKKKNKEKKSKNKSFDVDKDIDTKEFPNVVVGSGHSPKPSPKKDKAKKLRKKLLSSMTSLTSVKR